MKIKACGEIDDKGPLLRRLGEWCCGPNKAPEWNNRDFNSGELSNSCGGRSCGIDDKRRRNAPLVRTNTLNLLSFNVDTDDLFFRGNGDAKLLSAAPISFRDPGGIRDAVFTAICCSQ